MVVHVKTYCDITNRDVGRYSILWCVLYRYVLKNRGVSLSKSICEDNNRVVERKVFISDGLKNIFYGISWSAIRQE